MLIYIVRHGETAANNMGYLQGWSHDPLNQNGRRLAEITGQKMKGIKFDHCISSPLIRTKETAEIILRESRNNLDIKYDDRLKEISFGIFERTSIRNEEAVRFLQDPILGFEFNGGESISDVMKRTQNFLKELINKDDGKQYLIITHGCALRAMLNFLYEEPGDFWHGKVPYNCCVNIISAENGRAQLIADDIIYYPFDMAIDRYKC